MSTHAIVTFGTSKTNPTLGNLTDAVADYEISAAVYIHSDGYSSWLGKNIFEFFDRCSKLNDDRFTDAAYLAAKFVVFSADLTADNDPLNFLGVGIAYGTNGDVPNYSQGYNYRIFCQGSGQPVVVVESVGYAPVGKNPVTSREILTPTLCEMDELGVI